MSTVASIHRGLGFGFVALALLQFFFAGLGVFGEGYDPHRVMGMILVAAALVLVILAAAGRRETLMQSGVLLVLMILQSVLAQVGEDVSILGALHPLNGLLILFVAHQTARGLPLPFGGASRGSHTDLA
jgi:hypothetical membrane protein